MSRCDFVMKSNFNRFVREMKNHLGMANNEPPVALRKEHKRTQLIDVQRRIRIYLQALWGCNFVIKAIDGDPESSERRRPYVRNDLIHLPSAYYDFTLRGVTQFTGLETYRAASAHAAAHIIYSKNHFSEKSLDKWQRALISTIEDARVETLSIRRFPGLKQLWTRHHTANALHNRTAGDYLNRLAHALLDETYQDDDPWINQGRTMFRAVDELETNNISLHLGLTLAHAFQKKNIKMNFRSDKLTAFYRDDNRHLWESTKSDSSEEQELPDYFSSFKLLLKSNEVTSTEDDIKQSWMKDPVIGATAADTYIYSEWDYRGQMDTPSWVTLREKSPKPGNLSIVDSIIAQNNHLISRMKNLLHAIQSRGVLRIRKLEEGDEIDINAAVCALVDIRMSEQPETRVMMRSVRKPKLPA